MIYGDSAASQRKAIRRSPVRSDRRGCAVLAVGARGCRLHLGVHAEARADREDHEGRGPYTSGARAGANGVGRRCISFRKYHFCFSLTQAALAPSCERLCCTLNLTSTANPDVIVSNSVNCLANWEVELDGKPAWETYEKWLPAEAAALWRSGVNPSPYPTSPNPSPKSYIEGIGNHMLRR